MSILIKGMEMPTNCSMCLLSKLSQTGESLVCNYTLSTTPWDERPFDCPLVPVPPHGRLIDESAIDLSKYDKAAHDALHNGKGSILYDIGVLAGARAITQLVRSAPTIIPAEEGE